MNFKVPILMYHMVAETYDTNESKYCCSPSKFKNQMVFLKRTGYKVVGLNELVDTIKNGGQLHRKSVVITLDDGYMDNWENAFPILHEFGFPATIFVISQLVGHTNEWMQKDGYKKIKLSGWSELKKMVAKGITIGAHTRTHPLLTEIDIESATEEIQGVKKELEDELGLPINLFAYPYGKMNETVRQIVKGAGYEAACSTVSGFNCNDQDLYTLKRLDIYGTDSLFQFALKLKFGTNKIGMGGLTKYYFSRFLARFLI
ncbi:MAG: polysaccharide deacetylase family protein [Candidatus Brocadiaceae bacterium]|nr:polysaccharide deacetylase family protein [Candidatus Brocadiaceae bacterium]